MVCLNGDVIKRATISEMPAGNARFLMDSVFELAQRINKFGLSDAEIGLFCAVVIITAGEYPSPVFYGIWVSGLGGNPRIRYLSPPVSFPAVATALWPPRPRLE